MSFEGDKEEEVKEEQEEQPVVKAICFPIAD